MTFFKPALVQQPQIQQQQQQQQSPPQHTYLSALRDLQAADAEENLRKKREQQVLLAESLRRQIEEKQQRKKQQQQIEQASSNPKNLSQPKIHFTFGEETKNKSQQNLVNNNNYTNNNNNNNNSSNNGNNFVLEGDQSYQMNENSLNFTDDIDFSDFKFSILNQNNVQQQQQQQQQQQIQQKTQKQSKFKPKIFTKADLSQFDHFGSISSINTNSNSKPSGPIQTYTDSPFSNSTVPTPPQGFSMRPLPIVQAQPIAIPSNNNNNSNNINMNTSTLNNVLNNKNSSIERGKSKSALGGTNNLADLEDLYIGNFHNNKIDNNPNNNINNNVNNSLSGINMNINENCSFNTNNVNENFFNASKEKKKKNEKGGYRPPQVRAKSVLLKTPENLQNMAKLGGEAEMVYPDGHISPVVSSRDV